MTLLETWAWILAAILFIGSLIALGTAVVVVMCWILERSISAVEAIIINHKEE